MGEAGPDPGGGGQTEAFFASSSDPLWHSVALGAVSGSTCVLVGHPLDSIKVRLQSNQTKNIFRNLYRGVAPPLMGVVPSWVGVFLAYGTTLKLLGRDDAPAIACAGLVAGSAYSAIMCPLELVKVNAQRYQLNSIDAARKVHGTVGVGGAYRGMSACLLRDTSQSVCYYLVADALHRTPKMQQTFGSSAPLFAGAITGVAHCLVEFPFDTIKTRYQTTMNATYRDVVVGITNSATERRTIAKAMVPMLTRAVFAHGCSFMAVTKFKEHFLDPD